MGKPVGDDGGKDDGEIFEVLFLPVDLMGARDVIENSGELIDVLIWVLVALV